MLGYAEIHYRPKGFPGILYRRMPEILFDTPRRVVGGRPVPLILIVRDTHLFPVRLDEAVVQILYEDGGERIARFPYGGVEIRDPLWWDAINIMPERPGVLRVMPHLFGRRGKKRIHVTVDNYPGSSKGALVVDASAPPYPSRPGWYHGDLHCHSAFTGDQIEFGAPLESITLGAYAQGLDWIAVTDHSYDFDGPDGNGKMEGWRALRERAGVLSTAFTVLPGEEITVSSAGGRNVHMLAVGASRFIPGTGDGGRKGLDTSTEYTAAEAAALCTEWGGIACAAHPYERPSLPERLVLNRGVWTAVDLTAPGVSAMQIYNGVRDRGFRDGMRAWAAQLNVGKRMTVLGGSDSHGDMNRRRRITVPLFAIGESMDHTLGSVRTVVNAPSSSQSDILAALKTGRTIVTDGPFLDFRVHAGDETARPGDEIGRGTCVAVMEALPLPGAGDVVRVTLRGGTVDGSGERVIGDWTAETVPADGAIELTVDTIDLRYLRAECRGDDGSLCFTNPVWVVD